MPVPLSRKKIWLNRAIVILTALFGILLYFTNIEKGFHTQKELYRMNEGQLKELLSKRQKELEECHVKYMTIKDKQEVKRLSDMKSKEKEVQMYQKDINAQLRTVLQQKGKGLFTPSKDFLVKDILYYQEQINKCSHDIKNIDSLVRREAINLYNKIRKEESINALKILQIMKRS